MDSPNGELPRASKPGLYVASDGRELCYRHWVPLGFPRGYVVALHGIQSHAGWYEYSSSRLAEAGYDLRFLDRRGSGQNSEDRGHAAHSDRLINDVAQMLSEVCWLRDQMASRVPVVLLGVSWGGTLAAAIAARRPELLDGLALLYPGLCARVRPRWYQRWLLKLGESLGAGRKLIRIPLDDPALFTGESAWQEFLRTDPLALHHATVSFLNASLALDAEAHARAEEISQPTLVMLAGQDQIVDNEATRRYLNRLGTSQLEVKEYPEARHTLEFEPNREAIFSDLIDWLNALPVR